jgi:hypothetical protein
MQRRASNDDKLRAVKDAPSPTNVSELRAYLGLVNYYRKFLPNLATMLSPLYQLLGKDQEWQWGPKQRKAFRESQDSLTSDRVLVHFDPDRELLLCCDASPYGIGAVLQHRINGSERPIAYASRRLNKAEANYSQIEKEGLAIIFGVTKFRQYILGRKFRLLTDHKPLLNIFSPKRNADAGSVADKKMVVDVGRFRLRN